jgi:hypothetical protein
VTWRERRAARKLQRAEDRYDDYAEYVGKWAWGYPRSQRRAMYAKRDRLEAERDALVEACMNVGRDD